MQNDNLDKITQHWGDVEFCMQSRDQQVAGARCSHLEKINMNW